MSNFLNDYYDNEDRDEDILSRISRPLTDAEKAAVFSGDLSGARKFFDDLEAAGDRAISEQDRMIFALCRPARMLDIIRRFTVFDAGVRKIARHQQYFGIRTAVERVKQVDKDGKRRGVNSATVGNTDPAAASTDIRNKVVLSHQLFPMTHSSYRNIPAIKKVDL